MLCLLTSSLTGEARAASLAARLHAFIARSRRSWMTIEKATAPGSLTGDRATVVGRWQ